MAHDAEGAGEDVDLLTRTGLPPDLRLLIERYPRETWQAHPNLGAMARFWLERHRMFRELGVALTDGTSTFRDERIEVEPFVRWLAPRFNFFLNELHMHHMVEDQHYFPVFRAAERRLARGFDILDADHHTIDRFIHELAEAGTDLAGRRAAGKEFGAARERLGERLEGTLRVLVRHLDDEEDLVVPLILDRSEAGLGVA